MKASILPGLLVVAAWIPALSGCSQSTPPQSSPPYYWESLHLLGQDFVDFAVVDDVLYAADRTQGVHYQKPAYSGRWKNLGLETEVLSHPSVRYGVTSIVVQENRITAGLDLPHDDPRPRLLEWNFGQGRWSPPPFDPGTVQDLMLTDPGEIIGLDRESTFARASGSVWELSAHRLSDLQNGRLFRGPDGIYCGGSDSNRRPRLYRSADGGNSWEDIDMAGILGVGQGIVRAFAGFDREPLLFCTVDADIYRSEDGGRSYEQILELPRIPGEIHLNPANPDEVLVIGGNVFWSRDRGESWDVFFLPLRFPARRSIMDWNRRKLVVAVNDGLKEALYAFDLNTAALFLD